jgi:hypothetical protein
MGKKSTVRLSLFFLTPLLFAADQTLWEERYKEISVLPLLWEGKSFIRANGTGMSQITERKLVQTKEALKEGFGEVQEYYNPLYEKLTIQGHVLAPDGRRTPCKEIQDNSVTGDDASYADIHVVTMTPPQLTVGSILEWTVTRVRTRPHIPGAYSEEVRLDPWRAPLKHLHYSVQVDKDIPLVVSLSNGAPPATITKKRGQLIYAWDLENLEGIQEEPKMPPYGRVSRKVTVNLWKEWEPLDKYFWPLIQKTIEPSPAIRKLADDLTRDTSIIDVKIQNIYNYIDDNVRYVSMDIGRSGYIPHRPEETLKNKYGDCKDRTVLAMALLKSIGVNSYACLFASDGLAPNLAIPTPRHFNHMISAVDFEGLHFVESTDGSYPYRELHPGLDGGHIFLVDGKGGRLIDLPYADVEKTDMTDRLIANLKDDGSATVEDSGIIFREGIGSLRMEFRRMFSNSPEKVEKVTQQWMGDLFPGIKGAVLKVTGEKDRFGPIHVIVRGEVPGFANRSGRLLTVDVDSKDGRNYFTEPTRLHPIWFTTARRKEINRIYHIPPGFTMEFIPPNVTKKSEFLEFTRIYNVLPGSIEITEVEKNLPARLPATEYERVKAFYESLQKETAGKIVLRR